MPGFETLQPESPLFGATAPEKALVVSAQRQAERDGFC